MSILSPAILTQSLYRYVIVAVPLSCLGLGLGIAAARGRAAAPAPPSASPARPLASAAPGGPASAAE